MVIVIQFRKRKFFQIGTTILGIIVQYAVIFVRIAIQHLYFPMENAKVAEKKRKNKTIEMEGGRINKQCIAIKLARS